jgi:hypothetical protein
MPGVGKVVYPRKAWNEMRVLLIMFKVGVDTWTRGHCACSSGLLGAVGHWCSWVHHEGVAFLWSLVPCMMRDSSRKHWVRFRCGLYTFFRTKRDNSLDLYSGNPRFETWLWPALFQIPFNWPWPPLWSSGQRSWLQIRRPGFDSRHYQKTKVVGPLSLVSTTEELLDRNVAAPVYKTENTAVGIRHADHVAHSIRKSWQSLRRQEAGARSV